MIVGMFCAIACISPWQLTVGPDFDSQGANETVRLNSIQVGAYVDDTTPHQAAYIARNVAAHIPTVAGIPMAHPERRFPGALNAVEWYPFRNGHRFAGPPPQARAYILPYRFSWDGIKATVKQRQRLLAQALRWHPRLILWY